MPEFPLQVVWLKRDLRLRDHAPLKEAAQRGPCLCLYIYEPETLQSEEFDASHLTFINQSLTELATQLEEIGGQLVCLHGQIPEVFEYLWKRHPFNSLWSHEETGTALARQRDRRVADWCESRGVVWAEMPQFGVIRSRSQRLDWAKRWDDRMHRLALPAPVQIMSPKTTLDTGIMEHSALGMPPSNRDRAQSGGEMAAWYSLETFFKNRGVNHRRLLGSPVNGFDTSSRISSHLAWGTISLRSVVQFTESHLAKLRVPSVRDKRWATALQAYLGRLRWHCHFTQKFEENPALEYQNADPRCDGLREQDFSDYFFEAWCTGQTGYPLIDASMRCLHSTGWLNFRMRALLMSFASQQLWLDWRPTSRFLARHFLDFEPGIHFTQCQTYAGTMGNEALPMLSPTRQTVEHDPHGQFIRQWVNELASVPDAHIAEPWKMPSKMQGQSGCIIGKSYPAPIVDHDIALRMAKEKFSLWKKVTQFPQPKLPIPSTGRDELEIAPEAAPAPVGVAKPHRRKKAEVNQMELFPSA